MMTFALAAVICVIALGAFSSTVFASQWMFGAPIHLFALALFIAAAGLFVMNRLRRRIPASDARLGAYSVLLGVGLIFAAYWIIQLWRAAPEGEWDAWAIWNLHARFLYRGGAGAWKNLFDPALFWNHNDYPMLLPGLVDGLWTMAGSEQRLVPALLGMALALLTVGIVYSATSLLSGDERGALAGLILLATPSFLMESAAQQADLPLGLYVLTTVVLLRFAQEWPAAKPLLLALAGFSAALGAWTKNEGIVLILAVFVTHLALVAVRSGWRDYFKEAKYIGLGVGPILIVLVGFKTFLAPAGDIHVDGPALQRLAIPARYVTILSGFASRIMNFGNATGGINPGILALLFLLLLLLPMRRLMYSAFALFVLPVTMLAGDFGVYLISPYDLKWHMSTSLPRLLLQVWPACVFVLASIPGQ